MRKQFGQPLADNQVPEEWTIFSMCEVLWDINNYTLCLKVHIGSYALLLHLHEPNQIQWIKLANNDVQSQNQFRMADLIRISTAVLPVWLSWELQLGFNLGWDTELHMSSCEICHLYCSLQASSLTGVSRKIYLGHKQQARRKPREDLCGDRPHPNPLLAHFALHPHTKWVLRDTSYLKWA